ncbi:hypothetical protein FRC01_003546, partial [Tulasnella sp. 417]
MTESNNDPKDMSQKSPKDAIHNEDHFSEIKDSDAQTQHPSTDRFRMIRKHQPESALCSSKAHILRKIKTYRTDITIQSYMKNAKRPPPSYIVGDHLQADVDERTKALGEGASVILDRALVYISEEGDVGFLLGPYPFGVSSSTAIPNPTQYVFRFGKSSKDIDALGAWSPLPVDIPGVERNEAICEKLGESAKNWEYPIRCTPIIFRGFSERAKQIVLEAALKPQSRTLGAIDVFLEDGVTISTEPEAVEEKELDKVRGPAAASPSPVQPQPTAPGKGGAKIDYDLPPAPMPPPVDPSVFEDFDPVLPPEPDTPFDDQENPTNPAPPKQEEQQADQHVDRPLSPSAFHSLFELSSEKQSVTEIAAPQAEGGPTPIPDSGEVDSAVPPVNPPQFSPGSEQFTPVASRDDGRSMGVQTDEAEKEGGGLSSQGAVSESGVLEDIEREAGLDETGQSASIPAPVASVLAQDPEVVHQESSTTSDPQPVSGNEADLWNLTSALSILLVLQQIAASAAETLPNVLPTALGAQNDIAAAAPSQLQTSESNQTTPDVESSGGQEGRTTDPPDASNRADAQPQPSTEEESNPTIPQAPHLPPQQDPVVDFEASSVGAQAPDNVAAAVASASSNSEGREAVALTQPTLNDPSTPSGSRRSRPKFTPPSAESQQRPTKRVRSDFIPDVEGDVGAIAPADGELSQNVPAHPPNSSSMSLGQDQQATNITNQDERDQVDQGHTALASTGRTVPGSRPAANQSPESDVDTSMESATGPDPHGKGKAKALSPRNSP